MKDQHEKITGYRDLSQEEIDLMNEIKEHGEKTHKLVLKLCRIDSLDKRWLDIGRTDLQTGFMALTRAVARPESF